MLQIVHVLTDNVWILDSSSRRIAFTNRIS